MNQSIISQPTNDPALINQMQSRLAAIIQSGDPTDLSNAHEFANEMRRLYDYRNRNHKAALGFQLLAREAEYKLAHIFADLARMQGNREGKSNIVSLVDEVGISRQTLSAWANVYTKCDWADVEEIYNDHRNEETFELTYRLIRHIVTEHGTTLARDCACGHPHKAECGR
jgi:hypothetical protein